MNPQLHLRAISAVPHEAEVRALLLKQRLNPRVLLVGPLPLYQLHHHKRQVEVHHRDIKWSKPSKIKVSGAHARG